MSQVQITNRVLSKINNDKVGGYSLEELWFGIHPDSRYMVALAIQKLITAGKVELTSKRVFDAVGNAEQISSYRKVWS